MSGRKWFYARGQSMATLFPTASPFALRVAAGIALNGPAWAFDAFTRGVEAVRRGGAA